MDMAHTIGEIYNEHLEHNHLHLNNNVLKRREISNILLKLKKIFSKGPENFSKVNLNLTIYMF